MVITERKPLAPSWRGATASQYATHYDAILLLETVRRRFFGVSKFRLGKMLGLPSASPNVYHWYSGRSRPSQRYVLRLIHLLIMQIDGKLDVATFDGRTYWG